LRLNDVNFTNNIIITMARVLFFLALLVAAASAFVSPANHAGKLN
jgi:hypothetical protein